MRLFFQTDPVATAERWAGLATAPAIEARDDGWEIETDDLAATTAEVVDRVRTLGLKLTELRTIRPTLEQAVLDLSDRPAGAAS